MGKGKRSRSPGIPNNQTIQSNDTMRKKIKPKKKLINLDNLQLPLSNRFNILETNDANVKENALTTHKIKIAPIVVTDVNTDIQKLITDLKVNCDIKIVSVGEKIFAKSIEDKKKITDELAAKRINFFSHPDQENNVFKVILSGLPQIEIKEIENDLAETYNINASKIVMFNTPSHNKLYLCHFDKDKVNMKTLKTIKVVYHHIIAWQPYKPQNKSPTQCYRCCMYGHGARSCSRYAVCLLCSGNHLSKECTVITINTTNPTYKCFNCASANIPDKHKANDVNCPFRAKYEAAKEKARDKNKRTTSTSRQSTNKKNDGSKPSHKYVLAPQPPPMKVSFAEAATQQSTQHRTQPTAQNSTHHAFAQTSSQHSFVPPNTNENLWSFAEVSQLLRQSINELKQCKTKFDQLTVIANLLQYACE